MFWYNKFYITLDIILPKNVYILSYMDSKFKILIMHISILILRANGSDVRCEDGIWSEKAWRYIVLVNSSRCAIIVLS
jgi:hypothetical protein